MKTKILIIVLTFTALSAFSQSPKKVNSFTEDYVGKMITFRNVAFYPTLNELSGYYAIYINISDDHESELWGFDSLNKIYGAVGKTIAKKMIDANSGGGYETYLYGTITGKVIKSSKVFGSKYIFLITRIVNHPIGEPQNVVNVFSAIKK